MGKMDSKMWTGLTSLIPVVTEIVRNIVSNSGKASGEQLSLLQNTLTEFDEGLKKLIREHEETRAIAARALQAAEEAHRSAMIAERAEKQLDSLRTWLMISGFVHGITIAAVLLLLLRR
jgi:hypothetical protein